MVDPGAACEGCGLVVPGGTAGCQALFDETLARDFTDTSYFRAHRLLVDTYSLQHPDRYCISFKSLAAHLLGVCWSLDFGGTRALPSEAIRQWVERHPHLEKPPLPPSRGRLTIAAVTAATDAQAHGWAVDAWARSTWEAYGPLHGLAREWVRRALSGEND